jgi:hypothetical protein
MFVTSQGLIDASQYSIPPPNPRRLTLETKARFISSRLTRVPLEGLESLVPYKSLRGIDTEYLTPLASPLIRDSFRPLPGDKRSNSVFPTEVLTRRRKEKVGPVLEYSFTQVPDLMPRLPKQHHTLHSRVEYRDLPAEVISKARFKEMVRLSYCAIKKVKRIPKLTVREQKNLEVNRRKREELAGMIQEMNSNKEAQFTEIVDRVRRDFGLKEGEEVVESKFNTFDKCLDINEK